MLELYLKASEAYKAFAGKEDRKLYAEGLDGFPLFQFAHLIAAKRKSRLWIICSTDENASSIYSNAAVPGDRLSTELLPSSGRVIYSPWEGSARDYAQLRALGNIAQCAEGVIITSLRAFCLPLPPKNAIESQTLSIKCGQSLDTMKVADMLAQGSYYRNDSTTMPGEFTIRGEVVDIFPYGAQLPVRIYLDWDRVEKICFFEPLTQRIVRQAGHVDIQIMNAGEISVERCAVRTYLQSSDLFIFMGDRRLEGSFTSLQTEARAMYRQAYREDRNAPHPEDMLLDFNAFYASADRSLTVCDISGQHPEAFRFAIEGPRSYFGNFTFLKDELKGLEYDGWDINIYVSTEVQQTRLEQMLSAFGSIKYHVAKLPEGFSIPEKHFIAMTESEIFGRRRQVVKTLQSSKSSAIDSFVELNPGDYVVHVNYGIGIFQKIDRVRERDYIKIQFVEKENLYVPIEQANLIQRYIGSAGEAPRLDKLGSSGWESKKAKARKSAESLAKNLIELYARRQNSKGYPFPRDNDWQLRFEAEFEYEETEDQLTCIQDIKDDMESTTVMDRLICGDVGYGKTELAFRAAFKAVMGGRQVAFLAPTTILAQQHYDNFLQRIHSFPLKCALMSRMVGAKEQKKALAGIKEGTVDVLFGTHRIIQKDVVFSNLGLLVVDEEQRFGVKDKERIKELKANIDCLSLSATPIPRTLYMSLLKIRDMSLLTTPPIARKPIKTVIERFDLDLVEKAVRFELSRGGQVFYLHNRIETLEDVATMLRKRIPEALIETANGQMKSDVLEDTMRRFVYEGIQVLVSTTIIENGIDIPNVNTIIIDRADLYGVSQLYQLKGRVGRSDREAYAYLMYPSDHVLSEVAVKRLQIISNHTELGSGFKIAMKDMELRGAGNLLGREQSGFMSSVGLDMYIRLLDEEIAKLKNEEQEGKGEVYLELDYSGFIPDNYIDNPSTKLEIYKKVAGIVTKEQLETLRAELEDRFGHIPEEVENLLYICELRIVCRKLDIYHMKERGGSVMVEFSRVASISIDRLVDMIRISNGAVTIDPRRPNIMTMKTDAINLRDKALFILEKLERLIP